jgi:hypothetical protein
MSESVNASGGGETPAANQTQTEAMPADENQAAPPSGNLSSADPQAPTPLAQSAVDGGVPRAATERRGTTPGRPGSPEPDAAADQPAATADGGSPDRSGAKPSGEAET